MTGFSPMTFSQKLDILTSTEKKLISGEIEIGCDYFQMFKPKKMKLVQHKLNGGMTISCYEVDPITGKKLLDPYYIEHEHYRISYNTLISRTRAGLSSPSERQALMAQPGPQWYFLRNEADVIIYGGEQCAPSHSNMCRTFH